MRRIRLFVLICALAPIGICAQPREPQNIYRVTVNSRYVLENGERTSKFFTLNQLISDSLGRLHTEIDYDWETRYPNNYRWHYFDGKTLIKTDHFIKEKLARVDLYSYKNSPYVNEQSLLGVTNSDTTLEVRVVYAYNSDNKIVGATGYNSKAKRGFRAKYTYDQNGTEILRKVRGKRAVPIDSIISLKRNPVYDSLNRITSELLVLQKFGETEVSQIFDYSYDDKGNVVEKTFKTVDGKQIRREEFIYRRDNRIQQKKVFDSNNDLVEWLAWRYEIYKTNDRRQRVLE